MSVGGGRTADTRGAPGVGAMLCIARGLGTAQPLQWGAGWHSANRSATLAKCQRSQGINRTASGTPYLVSLVISGFLDFWHNRGDTGCVSSGGDNFREIVFAGHIPQNLLRKYEQGRIFRD